MVPSAHCAEAQLMPGLRNKQIRSTILSLCNEDDSLHVNNKQDLPQEKNTFLFSS